MPAPLIYHIAPESEFRSGLRRTTYRPARLRADGFVHCASRPSVLAVANDYFADVIEPVWLLRLASERLRAQVVFEAAAPLSDATTHLRTATRFPHVYGPLDRAAITGVARLTRRRGRFVWPRRFMRLETVLSRL